MQNLTEDILLIGHEADNFMKEVLHPDDDAINRGIEFINSANFKVEVDGDRRYLYDDNVDWDFFNDEDESDEICATLDEGVLYNVSVTDALSIAYEDEKPGISYSIKIIMHIITDEDQNLYSSETNKASNVSIAA